MPKFVLINGPSRSGKDTAAKAALMTNTKYVRKGFADHLKDAVHAAHGIKNVKFDHYESSKDKPNNDFFGLTPRDAYIFHSESYMKKLHGNNIFGRLFLRDVEELIQKAKSLILIPDSGFSSEAEPLMEKYGEKNFLLVRLMRKGFDFSKDSRNYITLENVKTINVENNNTLFDFETKITKLIRDWDNGNT
jgi:hypothetical protein